MFRRGSAVGFTRWTLALAAALAGCSGRGTLQPVPVAQRPAAAPTSASPAAAPISFFPLPIIQLAGSGDDIGRSHAEQLGDDIRDLHSKYFGRYFSNNMQRVLALAIAGAFETRLSASHCAEVHALAQGSGISEQQIMLAQCFLDLSPMTACSTITLDAASSPDGIARFGRNLDFPSFNIADKFTVVMIIHPEDKFAFASIAWPGMVGVLSGMNERGLALANMEVTRSSRLPDAMPYTLLYRSVLESCGTVDEAIAFLEKTPRQTANNLMLMDASGNRAVAEITPARIAVRRGAPGEALISTNHQRGADTTTTGRCTRYDTLRVEAAERCGGIDVTALQRMLRDVSPGNETLQSMVFEPAGRVLYLSAGADATGKPFSRLDLKPLFARR